MYGLNFHPTNEPVMMSVLVAEKLEAYCDQPFHEG